jgi:putative FmdB family regulatory protein
MPIFEYICSDCQKFFEVLVRGEGDIECPDCDSKRLVKKPSLCGFVSSGRFVGSNGSNCDGCGKHNCSGCMK